jgi:hypothetical protein
MTKGANGGRSGAVRRCLLDPLTKLGPGGWLRLSKATELDLLPKPGRGFRLPVGFDARDCRAKISSRCHRKFPLSRAVESYLIGVPIAEPEWGDLKRRVKAEGGSKCEGINVEDNQSTRQAPLGSRGF